MENRDTGTRSETLGDPGLSMAVYSAEDGSASQDGLDLLASWAASLAQLDATEPAPGLSAQSLKNHDT